MASLGLVALKYLDADNQQRREFANQYQEILSPIKDIQFVEQIPGCQSSQHLFQIRVKQRDELLDYLHQHEIYPGVHYRDNTEYKLYEYGANTCPNAHLISQEVISLPLHLHLEMKDIIYITDVIKRFYSK